MKVQIGGKVVQTYLNHIRPWTYLLQFCNFHSPLELQRKQQVKLFSKSLLFSKKWYSLFQKVVLENLFLLVRNPFFLLLGILIFLLWIRVTFLLSCCCSRFILFGIILQITSKSNQNDLSSSNWQSYEPNFISLSYLSTSSRFWEGELLKHILELFKKGILYICLFGNIFHFNRFNYLQRQKNFGIRPKRTYICTSACFLSKKLQTWYHD